MKKMLEEEEQDPVKDECSITQCACVRVYRCKCATSRIKVSEGRK